MRFIPITSLFALTLFLGGCLHVAVQPSAPPSNGPVTPTTTDIIDTSDWQTYTNEEYGFGFRYPKEFKVTKNTSATSTDRPVGTSFAPIQKFIVQGELVKGKSVLTLYVDLFPESDIQQHKYGFLEHCKEQNYEKSYETCVQIGGLPIRYIVDPGIEDIGFFSISDFFINSSVGKLAVAVTSPLWLTPSELIRNGKQLQLDQIAYDKSLYGVSDSHNQQQIKLMTVLAATFAQTR